MTCKGRFGERIRRVFAALVVGSVLAVAGVVALAPEPAEAVTGSEFDPGFIISDDLFFDRYSMSEAEVQAFLVQMVPSCVAGNGYPCLKNYSVATYDRPSAGTGHCAPYAGSASEPASRIIVKVAEACGISPKVLLVMLQKEQGLVTKTSPSSWSYQAAMGYGCPDTAACDARYYGFYNQVYNAAWQMRQYTLKPNYWNYRIGNVAVQYHPNAACGAPVINIRNQATANLYIYTPYQPNASALANLGGVGDACGSYGNRNFWVYFNNWFGSTGTIGYLQIDQAYARWGGASGALGNALGSPNPITSSGGGLVQGYEKGAIAWSQPRGAFVIMGDVRGYFGSVGGIGGFLGWPVSDPISITSAGGGVVQGFAGGAVTSSPLGGTTSISGGMRSFFSTVGSIDGPLGWPAGDQSCDGAWCSQSFVGGQAYARSNGSGHYLTTALNDAYVAQGALTGSLGVPVTNPISFANHGGGFVQGFASGALAGAAGGPFIPLTGTLRTAFNEAGGVVGPLGWPTAEGTCLSGVCTLPLQKGTVYWSAAKGTRTSGGGIGTAYAALGATSSALGWPATGLISTTLDGGGTIQGFEAGAMTQSSAGTFVLSGAIRNTYNTAGGVGGQMGWPSGDRVCSGAICTQSFQSGLIYWSEAAGGRYTSGAISAEYAALGGPTGSLGWPATGIIPLSANGGGKVQGFDHAAMTSSSSGTFVVSGGLRDYYNANGGIGGALGWPAGAMSCAADVCTQSFQGGTVTYSAASGGTVN
ncbi:MAG: LGFP repeat-containing protein [Rhodoglobus sp.]